MEKGMILNNFMSCTLGECFKSSDIRIIIFFFN